MEIFNGAENQKLSPDINYPILGGQLKMGWFTVLFFYWYW